MTEAENPNPTGLTDEEVLQLSKVEPSYFKIIISRYEAAFLRRARKILHNRLEAEDVVAETFTKIYFKSSQFKVQPGATFNSWAYKILTTTALSYYRRLARRGAMEIYLTNEELARLGRQTDDSPGWRDYIASVLVRMPLTLARVLALHYLEDRSQAEIAGRLGLSLAAVKTRIYRAKQSFREISAHV